MILKLPWCKRNTVFVAAAIVVVCVAALIVGLYFGLRSETKLDPPNPTSPLPPSGSPLGVFWDAAVTTNGYPCAIIGRDILMKNGSAVDAAIAALFCEGVVCLQSMGIGGGFFMTIYKRSTQTGHIINARETAPAAASRDMFNGTAQDAIFGGKAAAVPGELMGYWKAYHQFGSKNVNWSELIEPTIKLCEEGIQVSPYLANILLENEENIKKSPTIAEILVNPTTNHVWQEGDLLKRLKLAETLRVIAKDGVAAFYEGSLTKKFVEDVQNLGGIITEEDMANYAVLTPEPVIANLQDNVKMFSMPLPGSGPLVALMLNILDNYLPAKDEVGTYQRITESLKYAFGQRTELGDPNFVNLTDLVANLTSKTYADGIRKEISDTKTWNDPEHYGAVLAQPEDHGTAHISVLAPNGDAVSVTSTVNLLFGAMVRSQSTGIILNNEMDDFSAPGIVNAFGIPPSPHNFIDPGKQPLSSMCPSIFVDGKGDVRLVVGAAGGTKITSATTLVAINNLWLGKTVKEAVDANRIHHQLFPMALQYEYGLLDQYEKGLHDIGHETTRFNIGGSSVTAIARTEKLIYANSDFRRGGIIAGF